jgi:hypothetical protein
MGKLLKELLLDDLKLLPVELCGLIQQYTVGNFAQLLTSEPFTTTTLVLQNTPVDNFHAGVQLPGNDGYLWCVAKNAIASRGHAEFVVVDFRDPTFVLHKTSCGDDLLRVQSLDFFPKVRENEREGCVCVCVCVCV